MYFPWKEFEGKDHKRCSTRCPTAHVRRDAQANTRQQRTMKPKEALPLLRLRLLLLLWALRKVEYFPHRKMPWARLKEPPRQPQGRQRLVD